MSHPQVEVVLATGEDALSFFTETL